jgi:hypothetical protein
MARPEVTGKKISTSSAASDDVDAYSIAEFCRRHRISPQVFYKRREEMPATFCVGTRVLISREAAQRWRKGREKLAAAST